MLSLLDAYNIHLSNLKEQAEKFFLEVVNPSVRNIFVVDDLDLKRNFVDGTVVYVKPTSSFYIRVNDTWERYSLLEECVKN